MTHDELLDIIDFDEGMGDNSKSFNALRAIVQLHKPKDGWCIECSLSVVDIPYPCSTIQAIEKELG